MQPLGDVTVGPTDLFKDLGPLSLGADDDTIWLRVTQTSPVENWRYSYGLISFITDDGAELGTTKVYGNLLGEIFPIGVRRPPSFRTGILRFRPRAYNLSWLDAKNAPEWSLAIEYETGSSGSGTPVFGTRATLGVFADLARAGVSYAISAAGATIRLLPK